MFLLNPAFLYAAIWIFVLILYSFQLSEILQPLNILTILLIFGTSFAFVLAWVFESFLNNGRFVKPRINLPILTNQVLQHHIKRRIIYSCVMFFLIFIGEILFFKGLPILSIFSIGENINYAEFGISGLHGFLNSLLYAICSILFFRNLLAPSTNKTLALILLSIGYPLSVLSRQIFISLMIEFVLIYLFVRPPSKLSIVKISLMIILVILAFGLVGDLRSGRENIINLSQLKFDYPDWLPSALIWFYMYLCTPLNNINHNIDIIPNYLPLETLGSFIPSFARGQFLSLTTATDKWEFFTETFNASSLLQSFLTDFGVIGSIIYTFILSFFLMRFLRKAEYKLGYFFVIIVFLHGIALSFFANLLFHLVFIFQILIIYVIIKK